MVDEAPFVLLVDVLHERKMSSADRPLHNLISRFFELKHITKVVYKGHTENRVFQFTDTNVLDVAAVYCLLDVYDIILSEHGSEETAHKAIQDLIVRGRDGHYSDADATIRLYATRSDPGLEAMLQMGTSTAEGRGSPKRRSPPSLNSDGVLIKEQVEFAANQVAMIVPLARVLLETVCEQDLLGAAKMLSRGSLSAPAQGAKSVTGEEVARLHMDLHKLHLYRRGAAPRTGYSSSGRKAPLFDTARGPRPGFDLGTGRQGTVRRASVASSQSSAISRVSRQVRNYLGSYVDAQGQRIREEFALDLPVIEDGLEDVLQVFSGRYHDPIERMLKEHAVRDLVLDAGKALVGFDLQGTRIEPYQISDTEQGISVEELRKFATSLHFVGGAQRVNVGRSLHRAAKILDGKVVTGLTIRIGRVMQIPASPAESEGYNRLAELCLSRRSILVVSPGTEGKTTLLRFFANFLSTHCNRQVMLVDPRRELGGGGRPLHPALGTARCTAPTSTGRGGARHVGMVAAIQDHSVEVVVCDELIGADSEELLTAASTGVQMVASAKGSLQTIVRDRNMMQLLGGKQAVTYGDKALSGPGSNRSSPVRRKAAEARLAKPCFDVILELLGDRRCRLIRDVSQAVDDALMA